MAKLGSAIRNRFTTFVPTLSSIGYSYRTVEEKAEARKMLGEHFGREIQSLTDLSDAEIEGFIAYVRRESGELEYGT